MPEDNECSLCRGVGPCQRLVALLDSAARILRASIRNGEVNKGAVDRWLREKTVVCPRFPKKVEEMSRAP